MQVILFVNVVYFTETNKDICADCCSQELKLGLERAHRLRAAASLAEGLSSTHSSYMLAHNHTCSLTSRGSDVLF